MHFMNEMEIDEALAIAKRSRLAVEFLPYVQYLSDWRRVVNANSDGWPYWSGGVKSAHKLIVQVEALLQHLEPWRTGWREPTPRPKLEDFKRALGPIRACATRHKMKAPELQPVQLRMEV